MPLYFLHSDGVLVRDLAGFSGLALLTARFAGGAAAWSVPLGYGALAVLVGPGSHWAWPVQEATDWEAAAVAIALLALGLGIVVWSGVRDRTGEVA